MLKLIFNRRSEEHRDEESRRYAEILRFAQDDG